MGIFITGILVGGFLYLLGKGMEYDERKRDGKPGPTILQVLAFIVGLAAFMWFIYLPVFNWLWDGLFQGGWR